jgi:hypothetical protein
LQPALYEQFLLFGDSITQDSFSQERGFGFSAALQAGQSTYSDLFPGRFFWHDAVFHEASMLITGSDRWKQALIPY